MERILAKITKRNEALDALYQKEEALMAEFPKTENEESVEISWEGGLRLQAAARKHRILTDQPEEEGGEDQGMTPVELFVASLGTCIGFYAVRFFQRHGISAKGLKIRMSWSYSEQPHRVGSLKAEVDVAQKVDAGMMDRLQKVVEGCTVHHSISISPKISVQVHGTA